MTKDCILNKKKLENFRKENKLQPFRIKQINKQIYKNQTLEFDKMTDLSKDLRKKLKNNFNILPFSVKKIIEGENTTKFICETKNGNTFEAIAMYHYYDLKENEKAKDYSITKNNKRLNRITLCLSSQIGCSCNCHFCVTWKLDFKKSLSDLEILGQILIANNYLKEKLGTKKDGSLRKVRNVVFMGMGEPLLNYENVKKSIKHMLNQKKLSLSRHHITISTVGIIPWIKKMIKDNLDVKLAISLHHPTNKWRNKLIPINKQYPLEKLIQTLDKYLNKFDHKVFYEYIMIKEKTDKLKLADKLANLIAHQKAHVNLIPYNENPAIKKLKESPITNIKEFKEKLEQKDITVTIRETMWRKEKWACGQLGYNQINKKD